MLFAEIHARYIVDCLRLMGERNSSRILVKDESVRAYVEEIDAAFEGWVQNLRTVDNWFRGDRERITTIVPRSLIDFWSSYRTVDADAYFFD